MRDLRHLFIVSLATFALALNVAGCGGDDDDDADPGTGGVQTDTGVGGGGEGGVGGGGEGGTAGEGGVGGGGEGGVGGGGPVGPVGPGVDTDAMGAGAGDEFGPSARINTLHIPSSPNEALELGCVIKGVGQGSGLGALVGMAGEGGLQAFLEPDDAGETSLILLARMAGWDEGETGDNAGDLSFQLFNGEDDGTGGTLVSRSAFIDNDPANLPMINFPGTTITQSVLAAPPSTFSLSFPILDDLILNLVLEETNVYGIASAHATGFGVANGQLSGYLTQNSIQALIDGAELACAGEDPPSFCASFGALLNEETLVPLMGGYDTLVAADGTVDACDSQEAECNAISVCMLYTMEPHTIMGVTPAE